MGRRHKNAKNILLQSLELTGKPIFFLFTFISILVISYFHLLTIFTLTLFRLVKRFRLPTIKCSRLKRSRKKTRRDRPTFPPLPPITLRLPHLPFSFARSLKVLLFLSLFFSTSVAALFLLVFRDLPSPSRLTEQLPSLTTKIYDRHGTLLYQIYRDENRTLIKLSDLPPHLVQATIASEDKNFYAHHGLSLRGIARALYANLKKCQLTSANCSLQGGSTITQQLVKNALLSPEQTLSRKLKEAYLALWAERLYSKDEILELYFNYVPYGGTAYGIEEAAHQYFGKSARELSLAEASLLAGLPVAPTTLSPFGTRPYLAKNRQAQVLDAMVSLGYLTDAEALAAKNVTLSFRPQATDIKAPHFVMYIKDLLVKEYGEDMVSRGGLEVTTTLDLPKQTILESEIKAELSRLQSLRVGNAAGLIVAPPTGEILAMVGSHNFFDTQTDGQVNVTLMPRQPGSSIKPLTYTLAFLNGLTPNSRIDDSPVCFSLPGQLPYCPANYDGRFHGNITLRTALASSYNIPAIKLLNALGVSKMVTLAREMGITTWEDSSHFGLSLTLGGGEVTMYDLAQVYSVFANSGAKVPLKAIISAKDHTGQDIPSSLAQASSGLAAQADDGEGEQIIPSGIAYQISSILSDPLARAPAFGTRSVLNVPGHQVAVKTGTTNNLRDNWTIGYTPDLLVATWVGNNDNTPMSSVASGITGASPIWSKTMQKLLKGSAPVSFTPPAKMLALPICRETGAYYCENLCPTGPRTEYFVPGTEPKKDCGSPGEITLSGSSTSR